VFLVALALASAEFQRSLKGSKVYNVYPENDTHFTLLTTLEQEIDGIDFWQRAHVQGREAKILVPQESQDTFVTLLQNAGITWTIEINDVEITLENERHANEIARLTAPKDSKISFTAYHRHAEINAYLDTLATQYPSRVTVRNIGKSGEGRDMKAIVISTTGGTGTKPVIIVDAGIHAREWAAPAMALFIINQLVEDIKESDVSANIDWVIVPLINPDGYEYSQSSTANRMWRKTRSTATSSSCPGVDGNRNFDFQWMVSGSSSSACSDIFAGPRAFSEPETQYLRDLMAQYKSRAKGYLAIHSYGSYFLYPYGYNGLPTPDNAAINALGVRVGAAIDAASLAGSTKYLVGNSGAALNYLASGASDDYAYGVGGIKYAYTLELPGGGSAGFDLPPSRIAQVVKESWAGILVFARHIIAN